MNKSNINFHQTFFANFDYIGKILAIANGKEINTIQEISIITGIPTGKSSGKVVPHIKYCEYMNLITFKVINGSYKIERTNLGELIYNEDPYFSENVSRLICHYFLTSKCCGSELWYFIYKELQFRYNKTIKKIVIEHDVNNYFNKTTKLTAFNGCYNNSMSFKVLRLLEIHDKYIDFNEFHYEDEYYYALLYSFYFELRYYDNNRSEFTVDEIFRDLKWNYAYNWSQKKAMEFLEMASDDEWIGLNRQLIPTTVILKKSTNEPLDMIYSNLI
ncbi:DUF4007 family protein [Vallitalea guaymasensis]|uniref:DUF4007 family protein n=1 Tax=Vallitalea guaymasensis TaxID=1185412 RepID=UPI000DE1AB1B|nr:DUF4007 family protein [Vallitalea guaymasensis]